MRSRFVRVPRVVTFTFGAIIGGVLVYLSDADSGAVRRRTALKDTVRLFGRAGQHAGRSALSMANEVVTVARDTFQEQRAGHTSAPPRP